MSVRRGNIYKITFPSQVFFLFTISCICCLFISIYLSKAVPIYLSIYLSISVCFFLSIYLSPSDPIYLSISVHIYLSIYLSIDRSIPVCSYLSIYLSIYFSLFISIYLSQASNLLFTSVYIYLVCEKIKCVPIFLSLNIYIYIYIYIFTPLTDVLNMPQNHLMVRPQSWIFGENGAQTI